MKLELENKGIISVDNFSIIEKCMKLMKSYGPHSFASLTDEFGNYIQVGGGQYTCFVERFDASKNILYRANHENSSTKFPDGTKLEFGGGSVILKSTEWFNISDSIFLFSCFFKNCEFPKEVFWIDHKLDLRK